MTAIAAVAAGATLAARTAIAALAAVTAGGIEVGRPADRVDVVGHVSAGDGCGGQWDHRCSQKYAGGRTEAGHMTATSEHIARPADSGRTKATSHLPASYQRGPVICTACRVG
jgi:hypothetical protein